MSDENHTSYFAGQRVLVTGGAGFIGSHLSEDLVRAGAIVTVVDDLSSGSERNLSRVRSAIELRKLDLVHDDLAPVLASGRFACVFHLAANADLAASVHMPRADFERNGFGTLRLLEAIRDTSPETGLIHTSTAAIYGTGNGQPFRESDPPCPIVPYAVSKLAAEYYVKLFHDIYGLRTVSVRLFSIYGPRLRRQVVFDLIRKLHANPHELTVYGDGSQIRDFSHVANVSEAFLLVGRKSSFKAEVYNVAGEETVTIGRLTELICEILGARPRFAYTRQVRPGDAQCWIADTTQLRTLGYRPRIPLKEGLKDTIDWFLDEAREACTVAATAVCGS